MTFAPAARPSRVTFPNGSGVERRHDDQCRPGEDRAWVGRELEQVPAVRLAALSQVGRMAVERAGRSLGAEKGQVLGAPPGRTRRRRARMRRRGSAWPFHRESRPANRMPARASEASTPGSIHSSSDPGWADGHADPQRTSRSDATDSPPRSSPAIAASRPATMPGDQRSVAGPGRFEPLADDQRTRAAVARGSEDRGAVVDRQLGVPPVSPTRRAEAGDAAPGGDRDRSGVDRYPRIAREPRVASPTLADAVARRGWSRVRVRPRASRGGRRSGPIQTARRLEQTSAMPSACPAASALAPCGPPPLRSVT